MGTQSKTAAEPQRAKSLAHNLTMRELGQTITDNPPNPKSLCLVSDLVVGELSEIMQRKRRFTLQSN